MKKVKYERWLTAQTSESDFWDKLSMAGLLRVCAEKPAFLNLVGGQVVSALFNQREVLESELGWNLL